MKSRILLTILVWALFVILSGCGGVSNCPVCGTTSNGQYAVLDVVSVPEHNNTGEPGGPFNSFDISWINSPPSGGLSGKDNLDFVSDRIGVAVQVVDTQTNLSMYSIAGQNGISGGGNNASPCVAAPLGTDPVPPPIVSVLGNWTRFGCRTGNFAIPGFGPSGNFGGFVGGQCCAARANQVNPLSGPNGIVTTPDGNTLYVGNGSSSVVVFDLTTMNLTTGAAPQVLAVIPTGLSPDYDGQIGNSNSVFPNITGVAGCVQSANGRAFSDPSCGDLRGDEISYDPKDQILAVINGDPGLPYITFIDMSGINARTSNCQPMNPALPYGPPLGNAAPGQLVNAPSCILGQIYYDGSVPVNNTVVVDGLPPSFPCPDASNPEVLSGVSGFAGSNITGTANIACHHGPVIDYNTGSYSNCNPTPVSGANCQGAIGPAGLGAHAWDPNSGMFLLTNSNSVAPALNIGSVDVINPLSPVGPIVVNSFPMVNCMPTSIVQGPADNFLVGCADHDGEAFPPNEFVINGTTGAIIATTNDVGGVDEIWYNPGDNKYYLAARDMTPGPVMGVIDAKTNQWLYNMPVNTNAHSIAVDPATNHVFMPQQAGAICGTIASNGCIDVIGEQ